MYVDWFLNKNFLKDTIFKEFWNEMKLWRWNFDSVLEERVGISAVGSVFFVVFVSRDSGYRF